MTSKYYGCSAGEYQRVQESRLALFGRFTGQLFLSLDALFMFFLLLLVCVLVLLVIQTWGSQEKR
jgi:hypothetical protein